MRSSCLRTLSPMVAPAARLLASAALVAATSSGPVHAQELLGKWDPQTLPAPQIHFAAYVSPTGLDTNPGNSPGLPKRTINGVLTDTVFGFSVLIGAPTILVTINVAPGTYDATPAGGGEVFPLKIPSHGVSLESWTDGNPLVSPLDRPVLDVGVAGAGIWVDRIGDNSLPASVVQGLSIVRGLPAILVDPLGPTSPTDPIPVSCEIRGNRITSSPLGIRLNTQPYLTSLYVVE